MNEFVSCKYMATHSFYPSNSTARIEKRYASSMARRIFALVVVALFLPLVGGCGFAVRHDWPGGLSPDDVRQQIRPGITRKETRDKLGQPYKATDVTYTWFPTFYAPDANVKSPIVRHESRDEFWIQGNEDFLWILPPPPSVKGFLCSYEVSVEYDNASRATRVEVGPPGEDMPKPPPRTQP